MSYFDDGPGSKDQPNEEGREPFKATDSQLGHHQRHKSNIDTSPRLQSELNQTQSNPISHYEAYTPSESPPPATEQPPFPKPSGQQHSPSHFAPSFQPKMANLNRGALFLQNPFTSAPYYPAQDHYQEYPSGVVKSSYFLPSPGVEGQNRLPAPDNMSMADSHLDQRRPTITQELLNAALIRSKNDLNPYPSASTYPSHRLREPVGDVQTHRMPQRPLHDGRVEPVGLSRYPEGQFRSHTPHTTGTTSADHSPDSPIPQFFSEDRRPTIRPMTSSFTAISDLRTQMNHFNSQSPEYPQSEPISMTGRRAISPMSNKSDIQYHSYADNSAFAASSSRSLPNHQFTSPWPSELPKGHTATTPASTEGSADPAQSDQEEIDSRYTLYPSTSASNGVSRWARFRVPEDIFMNPPDPVRHELYHRIRQEHWFIRQTTERSLLANEAERILGSNAGESVLLAFYDRIIDETKKVVMRCTICARTNPAAQLYPRPDRAKVHMRHHFELRPIPCKGQCKTPQCNQRFFTHSDLTAHVNGKTEPLASCPWCQKTMRQKNIKRHIKQFCQRKPTEDN